MYCIFLQKNILCYGLHNMLKMENEQKIFQILSNMHLQYVIVFHYPVCPVSWLNSITLKWGRICNPVVSGVSPGTYLSLNIVADR